MIKLLLLFPLLLLAGKSFDGGEFVSRLNFANPYANIPAQCYIETSFGTQNACLFCHTNGVARIELGNNNPQAGDSMIVGNLQLSYAFGPASNLAPTPNINRWENTLFPQKLQEEFLRLKIDESKWDMDSYIKEDNWSAGYQKRGTKGFRYFPDLNPSFLPARDDGFVYDSKGNNTLWRSINFFPYGIFTPLNGSVSGIYIRLPEVFAKNDKDNIDIEIYKKNLDLLEDAITDRLNENSPKHYFGKASTIEVHRGLYPAGSEFAHPLHYVDMDKNGTRANRVKEIRYSYKYKNFYPGELAEKEEDGAIYLNEKEGWIDNGAGWYLAGFIEDSKGGLRAQNGEELLQCMGCHSDKYGFEPGWFTSGSSNTIDTTWALPRKYAGKEGWGEMDYLGHYIDKDKKPRAKKGDVKNRHLDKGEFRLFLDYVVGVNLYGVMDTQIEEFLKKKVRQDRGYSGNWVGLDTSSPKALKESQAQRQKLLRELTSKGEYLDKEGVIESAFLYPSKDSALKSALSYRKVVATQRFTKGKDVFEKTPFTFLYYRDENSSYTHIDGTPYEIGGVIIDRPYDKNEGITKGVGTIETLIDEKLPFEQGGTYIDDYIPLLN